MGRVLEESRIGLGWWEWKVQGKLEPGATWSDPEVGESGSGVSVGWTHVGC